METLPSIAKVVRSCLDDERVLVQESKRVDADRNAVLIRLANERRSFAEELERLGARASPEKWRPLVRELRSTLWARLAGRNAGDAIAMCRRSQHRTEAQYEKTLEHDLPSEIKATLSAQHARVIAARGELAAIEY